jgi:hypothetical protein
MRHLSDLLSDLVVALRMHDWAGSYVLASQAVEAAKAQDSQLLDLITTMRDTIAHDHPEAQL